MLKGKTFQHHTNALTNFVSLAATMHLQAAIAAQVYLNQRKCARNRVSILQRNAVRL
jgi:hypothetical protein